jgi:probable HAF family extracellular repeat protein
MRTAAILVLSTAAVSHAQTASFEPVPDLPGGAELSRARAISSDGSVAVGLSTSGSGDEAFRWTRGQAAPLALGDLPGGAFFSEANGVSADGSVVFGFGTNSTGNTEAFRWTAPGGMQGLGFLPSGGYVSRVYGSSHDGLAACGENLFQPTGAPPPLPITQAFRWTAAGGMQGLGFLPGAGFHSTARSISADGSVVVGWTADSTFANRPFRWTQETGMVDISGGAFSGTARGVSADGVWVVGSNSTTGRAFRWSQATGFTDLGVALGAPSSAAAAVSADGRRVLTVSGGRACLWRETTGTMEYLQLMLSIDYGIDMGNWNLTVAQGISADGTTMTGYGINPAGQTQAWVVVIPPENSLGCCTSDYDGDGDFGTDADIEAFFFCLAGNCCATCYPGGADVNADGDVGTDADIEAFFRILSGQIC